jgi:hypothetical protein
LEEFPLKAVVNRDMGKVAVEVVDDSKIEHLRDLLIAGRLSLALL